MPKKDSVPTPGLYAYNEAGELNQLPPGAYLVNETGQIANAVDWNEAIRKIPWEKLPELFQGFGKRGSRERIVNLLGMYSLVAAILGIAAYLGIQGIIEGQALVAFLGAALGYLLSRAKAGAFGQQ